ncbi:phosphopantetheine-binding protein [Paenibacillus sp. 2TAF8]|jgi:acyl carrier protein|uniref:phosphopantetheine-binding protein n=1 Tax=Paenibacillus sp. 2TAF8 TaxID=3233020 RepID=UPI003F9A713F
MVDTELAQIMQRIVEEVLQVQLQGHEFWDQRIEEVGLSSLAYITILVQIESEFDFEFDEEKLDQQYFKSLRELLVYLSERVNC